MTIAFGAVIILLLLLPSLFFRLGLTTRFSKPYFQAKPGTNLFYAESVRKNLINVLNKMNVTETLFLFSIVAVLYHFIALGALQIIFRYLNSTCLHPDLEINFKLLLGIFSGNSSVTTVFTNSAMQTNVLWFLMYTLTGSFFSFYFSQKLMDAVPAYPNSVNWLIGENIYYHLFTGSYFDSSIKNAPIAIIVEACILEESGGTVAYVGELFQFDILPDKKELAYITLENVYRKEQLKQNEIMTGSKARKNRNAQPNTGARPILKPVHGNFYTIPGNRILSMNIIYAELV
ncbi:MAG: hypothetical protein V4543_08850 [Bacteroidota bacterium]